MHIRVYLTACLELKNYSIPIRVTECHLKNVIGRSGSIGSLLVGLKEIESKPSTVNHSCSPLQAREGRQDIGIVSKGPRREGRERFCLCLCVRQKIMRFWLENRFYSTPEINVGCKTPVLENQKAVMFGLKNFSRLIHRRHILSMASTEKWKVHEVGAGNENRIKKGKINLKYSSLQKQFNATKCPKAGHIWLNSFYLGFKEAYKSMSCHIFYQSDLSPPAPPFFGERACKWDDIMNGQRLQEPFCC